jgi:hypothetical protein
MANKHVGKRTAVKRGHGTFRWDIQGRVVLSTKNAVSSNHFSPQITPEVSILFEGAYNSSFLMIGSKLLYSGPLKRLLFKQLVSIDSC